MRTKHSGHTWPSPKEEHVVASQMVMLSSRPHGTQSKSSRAVSGLVSVTPDMLPRGYGPVRGHAGVTEKQQTYRWPGSCSGCGNTLQSQTYSFQSQPRLALAVQPHTSQSTSLVSSINWESNKYFSHGSHSSWGSPWVSICKILRTERDTE